MDHVPRDKATGAGNQQERLKTAGWITGFVDGEGCFTVSIFRNPTVKTRLGYQVFCEFVVTQGEKSISSLHILEKFFGCGYINRNRRKDNHHEDLMKYCVRALTDLEAIIIPFFEENRLQTYKRNDFAIFAKIVHLVRQKKHLDPQGLFKVASLIRQMNRRKNPKFLESSETIRRILEDAEKRKKGKI